MKCNSCQIYEVKRSADVAPEVNLRNSLHTGKVAGMQGALALKPSADIIVKSKIAVPEALKSMDIFCGIRSHLNEPSKLY